MANPESAPNFVEKSSDVLEKGSIVMAAIGIFFQNLSLAATSAMVAIATHLLRGRH